MITNKGYMLALVELAQRLENIKLENVDNIKIVNDMLASLKTTINYLKPLKEVIENYEQEYALLTLARNKISQTLRLIEQEQLEECVLVYQGIDNDSLACGHSFKKIIRDYMPHIKTEKAVIYYYNDMKKTLAQPLTNYLSQNEIFEGNDKFLYVFVDNSISQEAKDLLKIKYSVAFDNHTKHICEKTDMEQLIINNNLGERNSISATCELIPFVDMTVEEELISLSADGVSEDGYNISFNKDKAKQLRSLQLTIIGKQHIKTKEAFVYDDKSESIIIKPNLIRTRWPNKEAILVALEAMLPQGKFKQARENPYFKVPNIFKFPSPLEKEKAIRAIKDDYYFRTCGEIVEDDNIIIYNDNLMFGKTHFINYIIKKDLNFNF